MSLPVALKMALRYARRVLVGADQFLNCLTGGMPDETLSFRAARARAAGGRCACVFCRVLDLFQKNHCAITLRNHDTQRTLGG